MEHLFYTIYERANKALPFALQCLINEPPHQKTNTLHMRKQKRKSAVQ